MRIRNLSKVQVPERRLNHIDVINMPQERFKFVVKLMYDLLPTPDNKNT